MPKQLMQDLEGSNGKYYSENLFYLHIFILFTYTVLHLLHKASKHYYHFDIEVSKH